MAEELSRTVARLDHGDWLVAHPGELNAVFFLPLTEPLGFPNNETIPTHYAMDRKIVDSFVTSGLDLTFQRMDEPAEQHLEIPAEFIREEWSGQNWSHVRALSSSVLVHQVVADPWARSGFDTAMLVARANFDGPFTPDRPRLSVLDTDSLARAALDEVTDLKLGEVTVMEAVVPLKIVGQLPDPDDGLVDIISAKFAPSPGEHSGEWRYVESRDGKWADRLLSRLSGALSAAVDDIRDIQKAYHAVTRHPITLLTRERLPPFLPIIIRRLDAISQPDTWWQGLIRVNDNLWPLAGPETLEKDQLRMVGGMRTRVAQHGAFSAYLDLHREAVSALHRQGDTRMSGILAAVAAETLLDELLLHLMWEEAGRPEDVATQWGETTLVNRVKREYSSRLGGQWDLRFPNAVTRWHREVAALRHRIVHGAYVPTPGQASLAITRVEELVEHLCDRLADKRHRQVYPRTALALAGESGLRRRNAYSALLTALQQDPQEPLWDETFARWRSTVNRLRRDRDAQPREAHAEQARLLAVRRPDGSVHWCLHDPDSCLAAPVTVDLADVPEKQKEGQIAVLDRVSRESPDDAVSIDVERDTSLPVELAGPWREEYRLVPLVGVMVDRSDLDPV